MLREPPVSLPQSLPLLPQRNRSGLAAEGRADAAEKSKEAAPRTPAALGAPGWVGWGRPPVTGMSGRWGQLGIARQDRERAASLGAAGEGLQGQLPRSWTCVCGYSLGQAGVQGERVTIGGARPAQEVRGAPGRSWGSCHWVHSLKQAAARG